MNSEWMKPQLLLQSKLHSFKRHNINFSVIYVFFGPLQLKPRIFYGLTLSFLRSLRYQFGRRGQRVFVPLPSQQAVLWLPGRDPHANAEAGHPPTHHFKHDNR